jgi:hypothetical protein
MTNQQLRDQFARCQQWNDPAQWDFLAVEFARAGFPMNAIECFNRADAIRGCSFAEALPAGDNTDGEYAEFLA